MSGQVDFPILSAPTISQADFHNVLAAAGSPMAAESSSIYAAFVAQGVNPAIGLAIAQHESGFGKLGIAVGRNDPYGMRYYAGTPGATNAGGWAAYTSWTAAARAEAALLASGLYGGSTGYSTARTFPYRYAPSSDGNSPASYGAAIVASLQRWGAGGGIAYTAPKTTATTAKATTGTKATTAVQAKATPSKPAAAAVPSHRTAAAVSVGIGAAVVLALII